MAIRRAVAVSDDRFRVALLHRDLLVDYLKKLARPSSAGLSFMKNNLEKQTSQLLYWKEISHSMFSKARVGKFWNQRNDPGQTFFAISPIARRKISISISVLKKPGLTRTVPSGKVPRVRWAKAAQCKPARTAIS
jgi:hypothetical protein